MPVKLAEIRPQQDLDNLGIVALKRYVNDINKSYRALLQHEVIICPMCGNPESKKMFYINYNFPIFDNLYPICKSCCCKMAENRKKDSDPPNETVESVMQVLHMMNRPFIYSVYMNFCTGIDAPKTRNDTTPFRSYMRTVGSLPQYQRLTWKDSVFDEAGQTNMIKRHRPNITKKKVEEALRYFDNTYSDEELMFLESEREDWCSKYEIDTKAQLELVLQLCSVKLQINDEVRKGNNPKDLIKTYQDLMASLNVQPRQNTIGGTDSAQTFGTLIQKYEETRPLPEIDPELQDVDKIGKYITVFFLGHLCKMLGIKNRFSGMYEEYMRKYKVERKDIADDEDTEDVFEKVFGNSIE